MPHIFRKYLNNSLGSTYYMGFIFWERGHSLILLVHLCKRWIHKRCRGGLSRVADGFRCRRGDVTIQEVDLAEDLMVDGETYECVKSFCYLGWK